MILIQLKREEFPWGPEDSFEGNKKEETLI
jgi:hypothetical protein